MPELRVSIRRRSDKVTGKPTAATSNAEWLSVELQGAESDDAAADNRDPLKAGALTIRVVTVPPTGNALAEVTVIGDSPDLPKIVIPVVISGAEVASDAAGR